MRAGRRGAREGGMKKTHTVPMLCTKAGGG